MIIPFLRNDLRDSVFEPHDINAMSRALVDVCAAPNLKDDSAQGSHGSAHRWQGCRERRPMRLRDRVLHEARMAEYVLDGIGRASSSQLTH